MVSNAKIDEAWISTQRERASGSDMVGTELFLAALDEVERLQKLSTYFQADAALVRRDWNETERCRANLAEQVCKLEDQLDEARAKIEELNTRIKELDPYGRGVVKTSTEF